LNHNPNCSVGDTIPVTDCEIECVDNFKLGYKKRPSFFEYSFLHINKSKYYAVVCTPEDNCTILLNSQDKASKFEIKEISRKYIGAF